MKLILTVLAMLLLGGAAFAQSGTINTLSVNPRQNLELTNSTGTESGQPSDSVPGSQNEENGLMPVTSNMVGSGSNGNVSQATAGNKPSTPVPEAKPAAKNSNAAAGNSAKPSARK